MTNIKKLIENADDAYYAAEYDKAIQLYKQVLDLDPDNEHAQQQLRKAEFNPPSSSFKIENLPIEALRLYKRSRSLINAGDAQAKKLLKQAILIAKNAGVEFPKAQELLDNLPDAFTAEGYKKKAFEALDTQQWAKALDHLNSAYNFDPIDDTVQILISHLQSLLTAQNLVKEIDAKVVGIVGRFNNIFEIREIIKLTKGTTALSTLWQDVVSKFGECDRNRILNRGSILVSLVFTVFSLLIVGALYLFPRNRPIINCDSTIPGLRAHINYPAYNANGDTERISITFKNNSNFVVDGSMLVDIEGTANVHLIGSVNSKLVELKNLNPSGQESVTIHYLVDEPFSLISDPGKYINFSIRNANGVDSCVPEDLHIAMSPIPYVRTMWTWLFGGSGLATLATAFFWEKLVNLLRGRRDKKEDKKESEDIEGKSSKS